MVQHITLVDQPKHEGGDLQGPPIGGGSLNLYYLVLRLLVLARRHTTTPVMPLGKPRL